MATTAQLVLFLTILTGIGVIAAVFYHLYRKEARRQKRIRSRIVTGPVVGF